MMRSPTRVADMTSRRPDPTRSAPSPAGEEETIVTTQETRYYLEMLRLTDLRRSSPAPTNVEVKQQTVPEPELNEYLYTNVGRGWHWIDRLPWTRSQWVAHLQQPHIEVWVAYNGETAAGYFELAIDPENEVEIAYFGVLPQFIGQGLGGYLLNVAVQRAWEKGASRVWLHTSTRDHPHALANYQARGFSLFKEERL